MPTKRGSRKRSTKHRKPAQSTLALAKFAAVVAADRLMGEALREPVNEERDAHDQSVAPAAVRGWLSKWLWRNSHSAFVPEEPKDKSGGALTERPICPTRRELRLAAGFFSWGTMRGFHRSADRNR